MIIYWIRFTNIMTLNQQPREVSIRCNKVSNVVECMDPLTGKIYLKVSQVHVADFQINSVMNYQEICTKR